MCVCLALRQEKKFLFKWRVLPEFALCVCTCRRVCVLRRVVQAPLVCRAGVSAEAQSREEGKEGEEEEGT